jgi:hypothetical protein
MQPYRGALFRLGLPHANRLVKNNALDLDMLLYCFADV